MSTNTWLMCSIISLLAACSSEIYSTQDDDPAVETVQIVDDFPDAEEVEILPFLDVKDELGHLVTIDLIQDAGVVADSMLVDEGVLSEDILLLKDAVVLEDAGLLLDGRTSPDAFVPPPSVPDTIVTFVTMEYPAIVLEVQAFTQWQQVSEWQVEEVVLDRDIAVAILESDLYDPTEFCGLRLNAFIYQHEGDLNEQDLPVGNPDISLCHTTLLPDGSAHYRIQANMAVWIDVNGFQYSIQDLRPLPSADGMQCDAVLSLSDQPSCSGT